MVAKTPRVRFWRWTPSLKEWRQGRCAFSQNRRKHGSILRWDWICAVTLLENKRGGNTWVVGKRVFVVRWDYRGTTSRPRYHPLLHKYTNQRRKIPTHSERTANPQSPYQSNIQQYPLLELKDNVLKLKPEDKQKNFKPRVILRTFLVQPALRRLLDWLKGSHLGCHKTLCKVQARLWRPGPASAVKV